MQWVKPTLVAQVRFVEFTAEGHLTGGMITSPMP
jgi:ATP-dependent DNA ligase